MALAKRLNRRRNKIPKLKINKKWALVGVGVIGLLIAVYGVLNLSRIAPVKKGKQEIKFETGDRPLPQKISLWVTADGGLFLRETSDSKGKILIVIPINTQLTAEETKDDWYKVTYMGKTGWVNKNYVTTQAPAEDPTKNWKSYQNKAALYSVRYPVDWVVQDYGANPASDSASYVGFGPQLSPTLNPASVPPVVIRVSNKTLEANEASYKSMSGFTQEAATIASLPGKKYIFNSGAGVQMTVFVVSKGAQTYIFEESGGYADELTKIVASAVLS